MPVKPGDFDRARSHLDAGQTVILSCAQKVCLSGDYGDMHHGGVTLTASLTIRPQLRIRRLASNASTVLRDGAPFSSFDGWKLASCFRDQVAAVAGTYEFNVVPSTLRRLGLGSSGAASVLFAAALAIVNGSSLTREELIAAAHTFEVKIGGQTCGPQDHAASVFGGLNLIEFPSLVAQRIPWGGVWPALSFWSSDEDRAAPAVIQEVIRLHRPDIWETKGPLTRKIAAACAEGDTVALVDGLRREAVVQNELGMLTERQRKVVAAVEAAGGAAKVSGAGGGGILVVATSHASAQPPFGGQLREHGLVRVTLSVGDQGMGVEFA
ncbi:MAG TPA: hypothetical protein VH561_09005 [Micromonosporaceae bacterium]